MSILHVLNLRVPSTEGVVSIDMLRSDGQIWTTSLLCASNGSECNRYTRKVGDTAFLREDLAL